MDEQLGPYKNECPDHNEEVEIHGDKRSVQLHQWLTDVEAGDVGGLWSKHLLQIVPQRITYNSVTILLMLTAFFLHDVYWLLTCEILCIPVSALANHFPDKLG